ncbi:hypothetical protein ASF43_08580 [Pseudorhodoferax sp. Leaf267]|nr:hypothetical protein ASF43_08580 [Pseudorhodoferax sp. Leaf267]
MEGDQHREPEALQGWPHGDDLGTEMHVNQCGLFMAQFAHDSRRRHIELAQHLPRGLFESAAAASAQVTHVEVV